MCIELRIKPKEAPQRFAGPHVLADGVGKEYQITFRNHFKTLDFLRLRALPNFVPNYCTSGYSGL